MSVPQDGIELKTTAKWMMRKDAITDTITDAITDTTIIITDTGTMVSDIECIRWSNTTSSRLLFAKELRIQFHFRCK